MIYGAIDIGTNSCRLLIAEPHPESGLKTIARELATTRIGAGVSRDGEINTEAMDRTLDCLCRFTERLQEHKVECCRAVATSAVREASNHQEFMQRVREAAGMVVEIISGEEEASLSYAGAEQGLPNIYSPLVIDLGGGSSEFICPEIGLRLSLPIGAVRAWEADMSVAQIYQSLQSLAAWREKAMVTDHPVVFVGGTASSLVALKKGLPEYRTEWVHGETLLREDVADLYNLLEALPLELRRRLPGLQPERADIINKGALITLMIMDRIGADRIIVSESDILDGIIWNLIDKL
ncbi:MAG: Ppx/GppA phosphatase family protein [Syntrophomonas sp.]|nr:Ppx/GppA phosphatase family protein [Syntrophomonas sp.]